MIKVLRFLNKSFIFLLFVYSPHALSRDTKLAEAPRSMLSELDQFMLSPLESNTTIEGISTYTEINKAVPKKKEWTFITYMAADNDLAPFARRNLKQQADVGSSAYINIVTQLDTRVAGNKKITKRYYIEKNKLIVTNQNDPATQRMDSGSPQTLIDCCRWAIQQFPAENYALILWNHGTGALDIGPKRTINPLPLFMFNPENNLIELDRSIPFFDFVQATLNIDQRAICFDDSTGHYLSNQDLDMALDTICTTLLKGKKFSLICFDACLMSMIEVANITKKYAEYMTASQEVELGTGYDYRKILIPFSKQTLHKEILAKHIVSAYEQAYSAITNDFTQSALNLNFIATLENNIAQLATLLIQSLKLQKGTTVADAIRTSRHKLFCTHFDEPSYIDLHHFYTNLLSNLKRFSFNNTQEGKAIINRLQALLIEGQKLITKTVVANTAGKNLARAQGISIYFPERRIHSTYQRTSFAKSNQWMAFLKLYLTFHKKT